MRGSKQDLPVVYEAGEMSSRQAEWGEMNVAIETAPGGADPTAFFKGLPGDRCQCPHWGYVIKGRMRVKYADREEVINAGDAYYLAPGHIAICEEAGEVVEFSPKGEYQRTMEVVFRNAQGLSGV
jgi:hypothetical protein